LIFPFELDFYTQRGVTADLVGHPLLDELGPFAEKEALRRELDLTDGPVLAVLPGSRRKVAKRLLAPMLGAAEILLKDLPNLQLALPRAQSLAPEYLESLLNECSPVIRPRVRVFSGQSQKILRVSQAALLASGTSTVEGTLLGVPMVVAYKTSALSFFLAKLLVKVPFISITNLLMNRPVIPELLQNEANPVNLADKLRPFLIQGPAREAIVSDLHNASLRLGQPGASAKVVRLILTEIEKKRA
jgi:lipid-A-disaccharide synthase